MHGSMIVAAAAALGGILYLGGSAGAQSVEEMREIVVTELGDPDIDPWEQPEHTLSRLPGRWLAFFPLKYIADMTEEERRKSCQSVSLTIDQDFGGTFRYAVGERSGEVPVHIVSLRGRLFAFSFEEDAYLQGFMGLTPEMQTNASGWVARINANRIVALTPRGDDLMIAYDVIGTGEGSLFIRCPE